MRYLRLVVLVLLLGFSVICLSACGKNEKDNGDSTEVTNTPTVEPTATNTPTPKPTNTPTPEPTETPTPIPTNTPTPEPTNTPTPKPTNTPTPKPTNTPTPTPTAVPQKSPIVIKTKWTQGSEPPYVSAYLQLDSGESINISESQKYYDKAFNLVAELSIVKNSNSADITLTVYDVNSKLYFSMMTAYMTSYGNMTILDEPSAVTVTWPSKTVTYEWTDFTNYSSQTATASWDLYLNHCEIVSEW